MISHIGKLYADHVRLNRQGYDASGRYWGVGEKLYRVSGVSFDGEVDAYTRAHSASAAKEKVKGELKAKGKLPASFVTLAPGSKGR